MSLAVSWSSSPCSSGPNERNILAQVLPGGGGGILRSGNLITKGMSPNIDETEDALDEHDEHEQHDGDGVFLALTTGGIFIARTIFP